jgi:hypothetical protein
VLHSAALLATLLRTWLEAADGPKYLFGRSLVQLSSQGCFIVSGPFVREYRTLTLRSANIPLVSTSDKLHVAGPSGRGRRVEMAH